MLLPEPEELLSVIAEDGLSRSVFTSILMVDVVVDAVTVVVVVDAFVKVDSVGERFSRLTEVRPFIRFSGEEAAGRRFFFFLLLTGDLATVLDFKDSVSMRFSPVIKYWIRTEENGFQFL